MSADIKEIKSGHGLGVIKFGMQRDAVRMLLGEPSEIEEYSYSGDGDDDFTESWHYDDLELSMNFDKEEDWKLSILSVTSNGHTFNGVQLIGLSKDALVTELEKLDVEDLELDDLSTKESPQHEVLSSESLGINFWFDADSLTEVQWAPLYIDDETDD